MVNYFIFNILTQERTTWTLIRRRVTRRQPGPWSDDELLACCPGCSHRRDNATMTVKELNTVEYAKYVTGTNRWLISTMYVLALSSIISPKHLYNPKIRYRTSTVYVWKQHYCSPITHSCRTHFHCVCEKIHIVLQLYSICPVHFHHQRMFDYNICLGLVQVYIGKITLLSSL